MPQPLAHVRPRLDLLTRFLTTLLGASAFALSGCASTVFAPRLDAVGQFRNMDETSAKARDLTDEEAADVNVIIGKLPPGMRYDNDTLEVDEDRYEVLAKVSAEPASRFFYPYKEGWRRPVCWTQTPLFWGTLFLWAAVPTSWPCFVSGGSVSDRQQGMVDAMKKATKAAGGNMLLVGGFGGTVVFNVSSGHTISTTDATHGMGWAIREKAAPEPVPVVEAPAPAPVAPPSSPATRSKARAKPRPKASTAI